MDGGGVLAVLGGEAAVAGGHGKAVGFADGGVGYDFDGEVEVAHHALDDGELLEVFFAEDGGVAAGEQEKFQDNGADAIEVAGSGGTAEMGGE